MRPRYVPRALRCQPVRHAIMRIIRSLYDRLAGPLVRAAGVARARDLHDLYVMSAQTDVPFHWHQRAAIHARVWLYDRICGPIDR